ncbi:MAG: GAF domain-containing protein [Anaerolineaceae bacterium]|nr:GAF domain-containing protein [Anaerolineaceae bacterium]
MFDDSNPQTFEETAKIRKAEITSQEQIRHLSQRAGDLIEQLRHQRDILRARGMNLPSGSMDSLKMLRTHLDKLANNLGHSLTELRQYRALTVTAALINSSLDTNEVLNQVMDTVIRLTGAERGYIGMRNLDTGKMEYPVQRGMDREQLAKDEFIVSTTIVNEVANTGEAVLTDNASQDSRWQGHQSIVGFQLRSIMAVPLEVRSQIIGVVYCDNRIMSGVFKQQELNLLTAFAQQAAVAIENARLFEDLTLQVTQMTELRDMMNNIFTSISSGVITVNARGIVSYVNAATEVILDQRQETLLGHPLEEVFPAYGAEFHEMLNGVLQTGSRAIQEIETTVKGQGDRIWNVIVSPLQGDADGSDQGAVIMIDDLTEIKEHETRFGLVSRYMPLALVENIRHLDEIDVGGQQREISVLQSDVRGFTSFSERLAPEELMRVINRYLSLASDAINLYEGVVDKYLGDAVTGLFNTQFNPQQDHALRAVRAAMSMRYDLLALHEDMPEDQRLYYGIGVHTGMVVMGNVGGHDRKEFSALGDTMVLGKLLQENAQGGEVLISPVTYELVQDYFECEPLEPRKNGGHEDFTLMYRVVKHKPRTGPINLDDLNF